MAKKKTASSSPDKGDIIKVKRIGDVTIMSGGNGHTEVFKEDEWLEPPSSPIHTTFTPSPFFSIGPHMPSVIGTPKPYIISDDDIKTLLKNFKNRLLEIGTRAPLGSISLYNGTATVNVDDRKISVSSPTGWEALGWYAENYDLEQSNLSIGLNSQYITDDTPMKLNEVIYDLDDLLDELERIITMEKK